MSDLLDIDTQIQIQADLADGTPPSAVRITIFDPFDPDPAAQATIDLSPRSASSLALQILHAADEIDCHATQHDQPRPDAQRHTPTNHD
jgi:hypothetical protein